MLRIRQKFAIASGLIVLLALAQVGLSLVLLGNQERLADALEVQHTSVGLTSELRASSDALTRAARNHVATAEDAHLQRYWHILRVRDGEDVRPDGRRASLRGLMERAGFTEEELGQLSAAEQDSNALVATEVAAFEAMNGRFMPRAGATSRDAADYVRTGPPDTRLATRLLHDTTYQQQKQWIMAPIAQVERMVAQRTRVEVDRLSTRGLYLIGLSALVGLMVVALAAGAHALVQRPVVQALGVVQGELDELASGGASPSHRLATTRTDELGDLVAALNKAMDRDEGREAQLRQSQKMEAVGLLAGGVAHDFNNLLTVMNGTSELLLRRLEPGDAMGSELGLVLAAGEKAAELTRQLLAFSRQQVLEPRVVQLNSVVESFGTLLHRALREDIEVVTALDPEAGRVRVDPAQMERVLLNLAVNARDAMPEGGRLSIETSNVALSEVDASQYADLGPGRYVVLTVSDTGAGMDEETQRRIFEPFFTTKAPGQGTGFGLATAYGIVKQSGGGIWVYSELGAGTMFKIYLPRVDEAVEVGGAEPAPEACPGGGETLLLVEDSELVRRFVVTVLEDAGYRVLVAEHAQRALELWRERGGGISLLLTDMVMPGGTGVELAADIARLAPGTRTIYMSGYAEERLRAHREADATAEFLAKPFSAEALLRKVRATLDA